MNMESASISDSIDNGLPQKVETEVAAQSGVTLGAITLITADRYYLYEDHYTGTTKLQFSIEIPGGNSATGGGYEYRLTKSESDTSVALIAYDLTDYETSRSVNYSDIAQLIDGDPKLPHSVYFSIWQNSVKLYGADLSVRYVEDSVGYVPAYNKYIRSDSMNFYTNMRIPANLESEISGTSGLTLSLVNGSDQGVAKTLRSPDLGIPYFGYRDERYESVFSYHHHLYGNYIPISGTMYRAAGLPAGDYGLKVAQNGTEIFTQDHAVQVVDGIIISNIYTVASEGFPPPIPGGTDAYVRVSALGAGKDDFNVVVKDRENSVIGTAFESRYLYGNIVYHVRLDGGKTFNFDNGGQYSIQLSAKDPSLVLYYSGSETNTFYPITSISIYDWGSIRPDNLAEFRIKAVNTESETDGVITFKLFNGWYNTITSSASAISSVNVNVAEQMDVVFRNESGNTITLGSGEYTVFAYYGDNGTSSWSFTISSSSSNGSSSSGMMRNPYFYDSDSAYIFLGYLKTEPFGLTDASTYRISLEDSEGNILSSVTEGITKSAISIWESATSTAPAIMLEASLAITPGAIAEGKYTVKVAVSGNTNENDTAVLPVSCITNSKIYASSSYPQFNTDSGTMIDGYVYMLKTPGGYDLNKFTYEVADLNGNPVTVGSVVADTGTDNYTYQDYVSLDAVLDPNLPEAYYHLQIKYDGKKIYNLSDPTKVLNEGDVYAAYLPLTYKPDLRSWYGRSESIFGVKLGGRTQDAQVTLLLYDPSDKLDFTPVKTIPLIKNTDGIFVITPSSIQGLDTSIAYDLALLIDGQFADSYSGRTIIADDVETVGVTGVSLDQTILNIKVGESKTLTPTVSPANASIKTVNWSSSNPSVATVDSGGRITGVAPGTAIITATTVSGGKTAQCTVNVTANPATLTIKLAYADEPETAIAEVNGVYNIDGAKFPLAVSKPLKLRLSGTNYVSAKQYTYSISKNGAIPFETSSITGSALLAGITKELPRESGQADGNYNYSIIIKDGNTQVAAKAFTLSISGTPIPVSGVSLNRQSLSLAVGESATLSAIIAPANATNKKVTWFSSNPAVAAVNATTGAITAAGAGEAVITATTEDGGKTASCTVNVGVNVSGTLTYGSTAASGVWVSLYKGDIYIAGKNTNSQGNFSFTRLTPGNYTLQAYSGNNRYSSLQHSFTVTEGDASAAPVSGFESKYANMSSLTVTVEKQGGGALNSPFSIYVYNYETGIYESKSCSGDTTTIVIPDLPYPAAGSSYEIYMSTGEDANYYSGYKTVMVDSATETCNFTVPVTYRIKGNVVDADNSPVRNVGVKAAKGANEYCTYTDSNGNFIIIGLNNGMYDVSINDSRYASTTPVSVEIAGFNVTTGVSLTACKGMTLTGKVLKGAVPAYKAYVYLTDGTGHYLTGGYAYGEGGYVFDSVIKNAGTYKLSIAGVYDRNGVYQNYVSQTVDVNISEENIAAGRMTVNLNYSDPTTESQIFSGNSNIVLADKGLVHDGSDVNLIVKYKNNGNTAVNANFTVTLPSGVTTEGDTSFSVSGLAAGASGQRTIPLTIGSVVGNYFKIPVTVFVGGENYDFGSVTLEIAGVTINGPGAVKTTDAVKIYGEAMAGSVIRIKNIRTGEVLGYATPNGRWYSVELKPLQEGVYELVAEAEKSGVVALSNPLVVESKADQITISNVSSGSSGSSDLPLNKLIGVRAFTAWVDTLLRGFDINLGVLFDNGGSISNVTYHFSDMDFTAAKDSGGYWLANISGWSGAGLKTITATVTTTDGRTLTFIIAEVTVLVDPSGFVKDAETDDRLEGVTVICEVLNGSTWDKWNAELYGQVNPQITDTNGNYGWMVPAGTYRVRAVKEGFGGNISSNVVIPPVRTDVNFALTPDILVSGISLNKYTMSLLVGGSEALTAVVAPEDATNAGRVKWTSSNMTVATVVNGTVTAVSAGNATITAKAGNCTTSCAITVSAASPGGSDIPSGGGGVVPTVPVPATTGSAVTAANTTVTLKADASGKATVKAGQLDKVESLLIQAAATLIFDKTAVAALNAIKEDITVQVTKIDAPGLSAEARAIIGDRPVYEFTATAGGKTISDFGGGIVSVSIPYTPKQDEDTNAIVIYYIDGSGKLNVVTGCLYDPATKTVSFKVSHFSRYAVGYNKKEFSDTPSWAAQYITYLAARGIFSGVGGGKYGSADNITRADFVTALARIAGVDLSKSAGSKFADVDAEASYANAVTWAASKGITSGTGNGKFSPKAYITRQDMAVMIRNFAATMNYKLPVTVAEVKFADQGLISSYAATASSALQRAAIISGKTVAGKAGMYFAPGENASRAETAKMLALLLKGMSK
jgi:uncharacterized protein YjdB